MADTPIERWELERSQRLVGNGLRFALESATQVAGMAANQMLWNRPQGLLQPLETLENWTNNALRDRLFNHLQPDQAYTLVALPKEEC